MAKMLDVLGQLMRGEVPPPPIATLLGFSLASVEPGHAVVEFGVSLMDDLARRDFTINAIAYHPVQHAWRDPFKGADDLEHKLIRSVGDPNWRFQEDYLRILRALRFSARFEFKIHARTLEAAKANAQGLAQLSAERVRDEWFKGIMTAARVSKLLRLWMDVGAARIWLPEIRDAGSGMRDAWPPQQVVALAEDLPVRLVLVGDAFRPTVAGVDVEETIRSERVTRHVSAIAAIREVRNWVNVQQREAVAGVPGGVVVDGRDIGTVVFPDAPVKVFLTASPEERARRRLAQRGSRIDPAELAREAQALAARDHADSTRPVAPLRAAADAVRLDTTDLSLEQQADRVVALARERLPG